MVFTPEQEAELRKRTREAAEGFANLHHLGTRFTIKTRVYMSLDDSWFVEGGPTTTDLALIMKDELDKLEKR